MDEDYDVYLHIYDLSSGLAEVISPMVFGEARKLDGIWHTAVVVHGREFFFGPEGINETMPESSSHGVLKEKLFMGKTQISLSLLREHLQLLSEANFAPGKYSLMYHNCNNFSNELCDFLVGSGIPAHILNLPNEVIHAAFAENVLITNAHTQRGSSPDFESLQNDIDEARQQSAFLEQRRLKIQEKVDRLERKKKKKKKRLERSLSQNKYIDELEQNSEETFSNFNMATTNGNGREVADLTAEIEEQEKKEREERKKQREPAIVFPNIINVQEEFDKVIGIVDGNVPNEDMQYFEELHQYMLENEGSWALSDGFLGFVGKLLNDQKFTGELRVRLLKLLAIAALKEDIVLILHQDRREHIFMNYAHNFDRLPIDEQRSLALFVCNLFENSNTSEWLLYISEWDSSSGSISNIRVTTKIAANALLSDDVEVQNYGTAIVHNLACKEVFDDVAVELTMALLQFFSGKPNEENTFRCMKALSKFIEVSQQEVSQLIQMIGPQPDTFKGVSSRIDNLISSINARLR